MILSSLRALATSPQISVVAAAAALLASVATAYATPTTVSGSYTVTVSPAHGNAPVITDNLPASFTESLNVGVPFPSPPITFFTAAPTGSCGAGCVNNTASGTVSVQFTFTAPTSQTASATANYIEHYTGQTDSLIWNSSPVVVNFSDGAVLDINLGDFIDWNMTPTISFTLVDAPAVPEPTSLALFGTALAGLGLMRRRRRA